jgi:hypothetical protein
MTKTEELLNRCVTSTNVLTNEMFSASRDTIELIKCKINVYRRVASFLLTKSNTVIDKKLLSMIDDTIEGLEHVKGLSTIGFIEQKIDAFIEQDNFLADIKLQEGVFN